MRTRTIPALLILITAAACKPAGPAPDIGLAMPLPSVVLFKVGRLKAGGKAAAVGDTLQGNILVETAKRSLGDLQLKDHGIVLRLKNEIKLRMIARKYKNHLLVRSAMGAGTALVHVSKQEKNQLIRLQTPVALASVRGTKFSATHDGKSTTIEVHEGKVAVRPIFSDLERLPADILDRSRTYQAMQGELNKLEQVLEPGHRLEIDQTLKKRIAVQVPELKNLLALEKIKSLLGKETIDPERAKTLAGAIDEKFPNATARNKLSAAIRSAAATAGGERKKIAPAELARKLKEYEELIALEKSKLTGTGTGLAAHNKARGKILMKRIEKIMGKSGQTLYLKGGSRVYGVIISRGGDYLVLTPSGSRLIPGSKVDSVGF